VTRVVRAGTAEVAMTKDIKPRLLKVREAQAQLNIRNTTFYGLVKAGKIKLLKIGRSSFVKAEAIDDFIKSLEPDEEE
jgi:excisionase family DNA binding protein